MRMNRLPSPQMPSRPVKWRFTWPVPTASTRDASDCECAEADSIVMSAAHRYPSIRRALISAPGRR